MENNSLGNRMKAYENISRIYLTRRSPIIIRIDGKAFHTFTRGFKRPFDNTLMQIMAETARTLCKNISGCKLAYIQSDEISLLLTDYDTIKTQPWFGNNLQKLVSISASIATLSFNKLLQDKQCSLSQVYQSCQQNCSEQQDIASYVATMTRAANQGALFDSRAFILPKEEVCNYFIWRQQDASRNSILMAAQAYFSHHEMQGKKCDLLQEMLFREKGINWNDYTTPQKRGTCVIKTLDAENNITRLRWTIDNNIPIFTQDKNYINRFVFGEVKRTR